MRKNLYILYPTTNLSKFWRFCQRWPKNRPKNPYFMHNSEEQRFAHALNLIPQLGAVRLAHLMNTFKTFESAWKAARSDYVGAGFNPKLVEQIISQKSGINPLTEYAKLAQNGIEAILINSPEYPQILKEISAAPPIIYVRGNKAVLNTTCIAIVGTRKMTAYGRAATEEITTGLVNAGLSVVSGLAFGVDAQALNCAVKLGGSCIAVLASPLDNASIAPKTNLELARQILKNGCLVSEYPLGASIQKQNFPIRNRIISGLSIGTVVVEADADSGALITSNFALEQNREVFAVPGTIFSEVSRGTNNLIKKGAKLVTSAFDVLEELNLDSKPAPKFEVEEEITIQEESIMEALSREPTHIDDITRKLQLPASEIISTLVVLEMKGRVRNTGGAKFSKIR